MGRHDDHDRHKQIAEIVARFSGRLRAAGSSWPPRASLPQICAALDECGITIPQNWKTGQTAPLSKILVQLSGWSDALALGYDGLVADQIRYSVVRRKRIESEQKIGVPVFGGREPSNVNAASKRRIQAAEGLRLELYPNTGQAGESGFAGTDWFEFQGLTRGSSFILTALHNPLGRRSESGNGESSLRLILFTNSQSPLRTNQSLQTAGGNLSVAVNGIVPGDGFLDVEITARSFESGVSFAEDGASFYQVTLSAPAGNLGACGFSSGGRARLEPEGPPIDGFVQFP
jgi:hypothetical protein